MKSFLLVIFFFTGLISFSQEKIDFNLLVVKDGLFYKTGVNTPFTGQCYTLYETGEKGLGGNIKNGIKDGDWIWWYKNGNKKRFAHFVDGLLEGKSTYWYKTGIIKSEIIYSQNRNIRQISYNKNGKRVANPSFSKFN